MWRIGWHWVCAYINIKYGTLVIRRRPVDRFYLSSAVASHKFVTQISNLCKSSKSISSNSMFGLAYISHGARRIVRENNNQNSSTCVAYEISSKSNRHWQTYEQQYKLEWFRNTCESAFYASKHRVHGAPQRCHLIWCTTFFTHIAFRSCIWTWIVSAPSQYRWMETFVRMTLLVGQRYAYDNVTQSTILK